MNFHKIRNFRNMVRHNFSVKEVSRMAMVDTVAITCSIAEFERDLGVTLFIRKAGRYIGLTEIGMRIYNLADNILHQIETIKSIAGESTVYGEGHLRIATTPFIGMYILPKFIKEFNKYNNLIKVSIKTTSPSNLLDMVDKGLADILITCDNLEYTDKWEKSIIDKVEYTLIVNEEHDLVFRPPDIRDFSYYPQIMYDEDFVIRIQLEDLYANVNRIANVVAECNNPDTIKKMVANNLGIGIIEKLAYEIKKDKGLVSLNIDEFVKPNDVVVAHKINIFQRDYVHKFIDIVEQFNKG